MKIIKNTAQKFKKAIKSILIFIKPFLLSKKGAFLFFIKNKKSYIKNDTYFENFLE